MSGDGPIKSTRGSVYVLAVVTLLVGMTLGLAMLRFIGAGFRNENSQTRRLGARNLAEAGVDYAIRQLFYKGENVPYTADLTLDGGTVHIEVVDDGARATGSVMITSTGVVKGYRQVVKRPYVFLPYMYAWCQNSSLSTDKPVSCQQHPGGMRVNGSINLTKNLSNITTGLWATGTITSLSVAYPRYPGSPSVLFPAIDYGYYNGIASSKYWLNRDFYNLYSPYPEVIYVNGDVDFQGGVYNGVFTVVVTGNVEFKGNVTRANSSSYLAVITGNRIEIEGSAVNVDAIMYCHRSDNNGLIHSLGSGRYITGCIAADRIDVDGVFSMERDMRVTPSVMRMLRLPGFEE